MNALAKSYIKLQQFDLNNILNITGEDLFQDSTCGQRLKINQHNSPQGERVKEGNGMIIFTDAQSFH